MLGARTLCRKLACHRSPRLAGFQVASVPYCRRARLASRIHSHSRCPFGHFMDGGQGRLICQIGIEIVYNNQNPSNQSHALGPRRGDPPHPRPDHALGILMDAVADYPDEARVYYNLARCECLSGNPDLGRGWLNEAYRLPPELGKAVWGGCGLGGVAWRVVKRWRLVS